VRKFGLCAIESSAKCACAYMHYYEGAGCTDCRAAAATKVAGYQCVTVESDTKEGCHALNPKVQQDADAWAAQDCPQTEAAQSGSIVPKEAPGARGSLPSMLVAAATAAVVLAPVLLLHAWCPCVVSASCSSLEIVN
jgi:hypothetical protein